MAINASTDANNTFNQYIPVTVDGKPIKIIPGPVEHLSEDFVASWVRSCAQKALSFSPDAYRNDFMAFARECLPSNRVSQWGTTLSNAGYLSLIEGGSILEFKPQHIELMDKRVENGILYWNYSVTGQLYRAFDGITMTTVSLDILVSRADPFNYEHAITIARIVL